MPKPVVITCAVTGSHQDFSRHPDYPITPRQIAHNCVEAGKAGAAVAHVHVRDPESGWPSMNIDHYREVVERVRDSGSDILINLTTGEGGVYQPSEEDPGRNSALGNMATPEARVAHVEELRPEICTLDAATMNFGEFAFINTPDHLRKMARRILAAGVQIEIEVFDLGHIVLTKRLVAEGALSEPLLYQLCLGIPYGAPATASCMSLMASMLPEGAIWGAFGVGPVEFDVVAQAIALGGNVRVGLEDNLYLAKGRFATNAELVDRASNIVGALNRTIATPADARQILGVNDRQQRHGVPLAA